MNAITTPEQIAAANKNNVETLLALANAVFNQAERLTALNLNTARAALEDGVAAAKSVLAAKNPQELAGLQSSLTQPVIEKVVAYSRSVYEIASEGQAEVAKLFEGQVAEFNKTVEAALEKAAKSAPAGSEPMFAAVKSALGAANNVYESATKATKQVTEMAEANLTAATEATVTAATNAAKATTAKK